MDYSELVTAINNNDTRKINKLIDLIRPRLIAFLCIHMNAGEADAKDIAQDSLIIAIETIEEDELREPQQVIKYMLSICKNRYLKYLKKQKKISATDISKHQEQGPNQLQALLNKEQMRLLRLCLQQLKKKHQQFMQFWFDHPDAHTNRVAEKFEISVSSAWTRKHRLIKRLNKCYQKKSKL
ncbi:RNA polymerase sigma factor [Fodinibius salsisoli]|uniref:Sigma-70 family RNA polymerase sigma factor n=1 Tax=Fodinibius salsisoli TaxID=2820877 RepID=A0ABT3PI29_9BACT|nr:sigma-70 family RNA polymerase sigma factor [Fodinibius salsisoli]MCW9705588.1 sigma-70 family RNA polymerase sigma factor [Fodinibius salsisoli]